MSTAKTGIIQKDFDIQGHRGCRGLMPENTVPAMLYAVDLGVTTLEMDVVITKDKMVILSHDTYMSKDISTSPEGNFLTADSEKSFNIYGMDYAEVKKWDVGLKPHPRFPEQKKLKAYKPTLAEVFDSVENHIKIKNKKQVQYNIETKSQPSRDNIGHPPPEEFVRLLLQVITAKGLQDRVIIQSFDPRTLQVLHKNYPKIRTALLVEAVLNAEPETAIKNLGFTPTIYSPEFHMINESMVEYCHQKGMLIIPWTANEKSEMDKLRSLGVDGIISDYPNRAMKD